MNFITCISLRNLTVLSVKHLRNSRHNPFLTGTCQLYFQNENTKNHLFTHSRGFCTAKQSENPPNTDLTFNQITLERVHKLFPTPKNTLNNVFAVVSSQLKNNDLKITPSFRRLRHGKDNFSWMCSYNIKWPESKTFSHTAATKQEASRRASLLVLSWLKEQRKITEDGRPLVLDKEEVRTLRNAVFSLELSERAEEKLTEVVEKYDGFLLENFEAISSKAEETTYEELQRMEGMKVPLNQRFEGANFYLKKTAVDLPINKFRDRIVELSKENSVVIIKGDTGCGKSTQVPQFILEEWAKEDGPNGKPCRIVVSQPRRIAAISLANRVASEKMDEVGNLVGYQVRFNSAVSSRTRLTYCTTGILLRYLQSDPLLTDFTHVIVDEAHERDVNTDLLLNLLRSAVAGNPGLRVLIMSATIDTGEFQKYFGECPCLAIPGFTYPVKVNFLDEIMENQPMYGTLEMCNRPEPYVVHEDVVSIIMNIHRKRDEGAILCFLPGWEDIMRVKRMIPERGDAYVLCLHSRLQDSEQRKIFSRAPPGVRKIILATNIAETSVTVDDVVYVVDTGIHKEERFDSEKGLASIDNHWISKSSMEQRKGRAGRVRPGESFHLYTRAKYDSFTRYSIPEILRTSLTKVVLDSKIYSRNTSALGFFNQLLCPPEEETIERAVGDLKELELLDEDEKLTPLGRVLANFQLEPRLSRAMVNAVAFRCVTPIVDIVSLFSADTELFSTGLVDRESIRKTKVAFSPDSDHLALMRMLERWLDLEEVDMADDFCRQHNLVPRRLKTVAKLRQVHFEYLFKGLRDAVYIGDDNSSRDELVKATLLSGVHSVLQPRNYDMVKGRIKKANVHVTSNNHKATITTESVNYQRCRNTKDLFLLHLNEVRSNLRRTTLVRETSVVSPLSVVLFKPNQLTLHRTEEGQVQVGMEGTRFRFSCSERQARVIERCKEVVRKGLRYYVHQMTEGGVREGEVDKRWQEVLRSLCDALEDGLNRRNDVRE